MTPAERGAAPLGAAAKATLRDRGFSNLILDVIDDQSWQAVALAVIGELRRRYAAHRKIGKSNWLESAIADGVDRPCAWCAEAHDGGPENCKR